MARALAALDALTRPMSQVPVDPDAQTAREWAEAELAGSVYHQRASLLSQAIDWILAQLADAQAAISVLDPRGAALLVGAVVLVAATIALIVAGPVRRARRRRGSTEVFGGSDDRSAAELRASADALADLGQWAEAVLDRFRAILRDLEDRVIVEPRPGGTAHEAAQQAGDRLPSCAVDLRRAGRLFDDVCYGSAQADRADDAWLRDLDRRVSTTRPAAALWTGDVASAARLEVPR